MNGGHEFKQGKNDTGNYNKINRITFTQKSSLKMFLAVFLTVFFFFSVLIMDTFDLKS